MNRLLSIIQSTIFLSVAIFSFASCGQSSQITSPLPSATGFSLSAETDSSPTVVNQSPSTAQSNMQPAESFSTPSMSEYRLTQECLEYLPESQDIPELDGIIVMSGEDMDKPTYTLDLHSGEKMLLTDENTLITLVAVSLDGKWVAYKSEDLDGENNLLEILSVESDIHESIKWDDSWRMIAGWLASDDLLISRARAENPYIQNDGIVVIDPTTEETTELPAAYPDLQNGYPGTNWPGFWAAATIYDSSLSRVLYPSGPNQLVLRDLALEQEISRINGTISIRIGPQWSPDDRNIAIVGPANLLEAPLQSEAETTKQEIFLISRDGNIDQMTRFSSYFNEVNISNLAWSPDSQQIAFSLSFSPDGDTDTAARSSTFVILNTKTREIVDYCLPSHTLAKPIWSPDGKFVVVENRSADLNQNEVFLIDLDQKTAMQIDKNIFPVGWLQPTP